MWPLFLEWDSKDWNRHAEVRSFAKNELIESMSDHFVRLFDEERLTRVFNGIDQPDFGAILSAIETRVSSYDDDDEESNN